MEEHIYKRYINRMSAKIIFWGVMSLLSLNLVKNIKLKRSQYIKDLNLVCVDPLRLCKTKKSLLKYAFIKMITLGLVSKRYSHKKNLLKQIIDEEYFNYIRMKSQFYVYESQIVESIEQCSSMDKRKQLYKDSQILNFPYFEQVDVSIIIPLNNNEGVNYICLKSVLDNTQNIPYEVILVTNSEIVLPSLYDFAKNVTVVSVFGVHDSCFNCDYASKLVRGRYIQFLSSNCVVTPNWLVSLLNKVKEDSLVGIVGSKINDTNGKLNFAGGMCFEDGSLCCYGTGQDESLPEYNYYKEVDFVSQDSILIRSDLWDKLNGFEKIFKSNIYKVVDLAFSVRKIGYKVVYQPQSTIIKNGEVKLDGSVIDNHEINDQKLFTNKWYFNLKGCQVNKNDIFLARDRSYKKKTILFIDHYVPTFDKDAGSRTIYQYLKLLTKEGYNVKFIGDNFNIMAPYGQILENLGVEILCGVYYANNWKIWLKENSKYLSYAFVNRPHIAINYIDDLNKNHVPVVYNVCDLHFLREERCYKLTGNNEHLQNAEKFRKIEEELFNKSNKVLSLSSEERAIVNKMVEGDKCQIAPIFVFDKFDFETLQRVNTKDLMFVGGFTHTPNLDAILWFLKEVFPIILKSFPEIRINIVGSNVPEQLKILESGNIVIKGFVTDDELSKLYSECRVCVIPLRYGAGVKGKTIEAMYNRIPIVSTSIGVEGLEDIDKCIAHYDKSEEFANEVIKMYQDSDYRDRNVMECYKYVYEHYSYDKVCHWFNDLFK